MGEYEELKNVDPGNPSIIKKYHKTSYPSISPLRPELSQNGKTVLVAGASAGIGFAIARAYGEASASRVILTGRREHVLRDATEKLSNEFKGTTFDARVVDVANLAESASLWANLAAAGISINVLVFNAAKFGGQEKIIDTNVEEIWSQYDTNVRSLFQWTQLHYKQRNLQETQKYFVFVSTAAIHSKAIAAFLPSYSLTKLSGQLVLQYLAGEVDSQKLQMISFHPGAILSETSRSAGLDENSLSWDDENLPSHFAVWAATSEAAFLHGRFVYAAWDVDEVRSGLVKEQVETDPDFLSIRIAGL